MSSAIHPTAIIHEGAVVGAGTTIGPYSVIGSHVVLGTGNRIGSHVVIEGRTEIGQDNQIFQFASVGAIPQDLKYHGEPSRLVIGNRNIIREFVTLQPGTEGGGMLTQIGDGNLFMANSHLGHDGRVGNGNVIANSAALAGHVTIGNHTTVGGLVGVHQFTRLGDLCILSGGTMVVKDIPPYCIAQGDRAGLVGINKIALQRRGYSADDIRLLRQLYRELFLGDGPLAGRLVSCRNSYGENAIAGSFLSFCETSTRGLTFPRADSGDDSDDI